MRYLILAALALSFAACSPESSSIKGRRDLPQPENNFQQAPLPQDQLVTEKSDPQVENKTEKQTVVSQDGGQQIELKPKLDILFVSDNSDSMKDHQENLSKNINRFVERFGTNGMIDFHIGVVSVWDSSERFLTKKQDKFGQGELRYAKDGNGRTLKSRFVYRFAGFQDALASTLKIGIASYANGGPETEELFSPLSAALKKSGDKDVNAGFFRADAQLVVILMTDADDSTRDINPQQMAQELIAFKGGDASKVAVYGVLVRANDPDEKKDYGLRIMQRYHPECFDKVAGKKDVYKNNGKCSPFAPVRLEEFIAQANVGNGLTMEETKKRFILGINENKYGSELARIGADVTKKTLEREILLAGVPKLDDKGNLMITVRYGTERDLKAGTAQVIARDEKAGWSYNPENKSIILSGDINYRYKEGARIQIDFVAVNYVLPVAQ